MTFDPMDDQRRRDAEQRERDRAQRESDRESERADRERDREHRREERRARHEARHQFGFRHQGFDLNVDVDPDEIARSVSAAFVGMDDDDSESHDQTIEKTFTVDGMPRLRVQNVSGETAIRVGAPGQVRVVARKRVKGGSADRAKRLLENVDRFHKDALRRGDVGQEVAGRRGSRRKGRAVASAAANLASGSRAAAPSLTLLEQLCDPHNERSLRSA